MATKKRCRSSADWISHWTRIKRRREYNKFNSSLSSFVVSLDACPRMINDHLLHHKMCNDRLREVSKRCMSPPRGRLCRHARKLAVSRGCDDDSPINKLSRLAVTCESQARKWISRDRSTAQSLRIAINSNKSSFASVMREWERETPAPCGNYELCRHNEDNLKSIKTEKLFSCFFIVF